MNGPPDPGGQFTSDYHRRVLGHLPPPGEDPLDTPVLLERIDADASTPTLVVGEGLDELVSHLKDLEADGHASKSKEGWRMTKAGFELLTGPIADEPPPVEESS